MDAADARSRDLRGNRAGVIGAHDADADNPQPDSHAFPPDAGSGPVLCQPTWRLDAVPGTDLPSADKSEAWAAGRPGIKLVMKLAGHFPSPCRGSWSINVAPESFSQ